MSLQVPPPPRIQTARLRGEQSTEATLQQVSGEVRALLTWLFQFYTSAANELSGESVRDISARLDQAQEDIEGLDVDLSDLIQVVQDLDAIVQTVSDLASQNADRLDQITNISFLTQSISSPPTQQQVANIQDKVNEIIEQSQVNPP